MPDGTRTWERTPWLLPAILVLSLLGSSCGIFETRDPEPPSQTSSNFVPPTEPSIVFSNMATAFRDLNSLNYLRSFADSTTNGRSFSFEPTPQARSKYGGVFFNWSRESEQRYFENLKSKVPGGSSATLTFDVLTIQSLQSDSAQYEATYRLNVQHTVANVAKEARGRAQFFLMADRSRNWVILRWVDVTDNAASFTWSDLKGEFGQ